MKVYSRFTFVSTEDFNVLFHASFDPAIMGYIVAFESADEERKGFIDASVYPVASVYQFLCEKNWILQDVFHDVAVVDDGEN